MKKDFLKYNLENNELSFSTLNWYFLNFLSFNICLVFPQEIASLKYVLFHFIFRFDSVNFVSIHFVWFRFDFVSHFTGNRDKVQCDLRQDRGFLRVFGIRFPPPKNDRHDIAELLKWR